MNKCIKKRLCRICNREIGANGFVHHLRTLHKIEYQDYVNQNLSDFPEYSPCEICGAMTRGITCSNKCRGIRTGILTERSGRCKGDKNPAKRLDVRKKLSDNILSRIKERGHNQTGLLRAESTCKLISDKAKIRVSKPDYVNPMQGKTHSPEAIKKIFTHKKMNRLEKLVADILDANKIEYYFQFFLQENDICKSYDFKIKGKPIILEIDGDYWHGGPSINKYCKDIENAKINDKFKEELANKNGYKLIRFWESDINKNPDIIIDAIKSYMDRSTNIIIE